MKKYKVPREVSIHFMLNFKSKRHGDKTKYSKKHRKSNKIKLCDI